MVFCLVDDELKASGIAPPRTRCPHSLRQRGQRHGDRRRVLDGLEDQLGALGLVVNAVVFWNTRYLDAALAQVRAASMSVKPEDVERLSPLRLDHINVLGRYEVTLKESVREGYLRPLRKPDDLDDLAA